MITDILFSIAVMFIAMLNLILSAFSIPGLSNMADAVAWLINLMTIGQGYFPVDTLFTCLGIIALIYFFRFQIRLFFITILPMIPIIGRRVQLPTLLDGSHDDFTQPYYQSIRPDPSNKDGMGTYYLYKRKKTR